MYTVNALTLLFAIRSFSSRSSIIHSPKVSEALTCVAIERKIAMYYALDTHTHTHTHTH